MKKGDFLWSAYRITEKQKAGKARNIKEKQLKNSRKSGLNAGGTAEHNKIIVSRPGICNSIPRRDFLCYISEIHQRVFPDSFPKFLPEYRTTTFR